jgi:hypothetical protein
MKGAKRGSLTRRFLLGSLSLLGMMIPAAEVSAAGFGPDFRVSSAAVSDLGAQGGTVTADSAGNFTYAWFQQEGNEVTSLLTRVVSSGGSAGPLNVVATADGSGLTSDYLSSISLSAGPDGLVHASWARVTLTCTPACVPQFRIQYVNLDDAGAPVSDPVDVYTSVSGRNPVGPSLATSGTGRTGILFGEFNGLSNTDVLMAIAKDDAAPLAPFELSEDNWMGVQYLDIAGSANGTLMPVWSGYHTEISDLATHARLITGDGTVMAERELLTSPSFLNDVEAQIDETGRGSVFALTSDGGDVIQYRQMDSNGNPVGAGPTTITTAGATDINAGSPYTAIGPDGTVTVAFAQRLPANAHRNVWTRTISPTGVLSGATEFVPASPDSESGLPSVAAGPDGTGFVTWVETPHVSPADENLLLHGRPMSATGSPTGVAQTIQTLSRNPAQEPGPDGAVFSPDGNGVAMWNLELEEFNYADEIHSVIFDASAPEVVLWAPPSAGAGQEIVMAAEASDNASLTFSWKVDGEALTATGPVVRHTFQSAGSHEVEVSVTDEFGNATTVDGQVSVSAPPAPPVPPDTKITGKPAKKTKSKAATFRFIASLTGSSFECRLDKAGWSACKSPRKLGNLKPGKHTFRVRAIKGDLLDRTPASYSWTIRKPNKKR